MTTPPDGPDRLLAAAELARLHVALEDVDAVLLVEVDAADLVEADDVVLGDEAPLAGRVVHEHLGHGGLAARHEVRVRGDLLEEVRLARAPWAQLDEVVVALDERDHPQQQHVLGALGQLGRLEADAAQQQVAPLACGEGLAPAGDDVEDVPARELDGPQPDDAEGPALGLLGDGGVVLELDLGVEAAGEHALVVAHEVVADAHVLELQAGQGGEVAVATGIEARGDEIDELDRAPLAGARLEELLLAGADGAVLELALDDLEALGDLLLVGARAVAPQEELADVRGDRVLALELERQVLAHDAAGEGLGGEAVERVELHQSSPPTVVVAWPEQAATRVEDDDEHERLARIGHRPRGVREFCALDRDVTGPAEQRRRRVADLVPKVDAQHRREHPSRRRRARSPLQRIVMAMGPAGARRVAHGDDRRDALLRAETPPCS